MSYEKYYPGGWQSGESGGTPITPEALNHIENGIVNSAPAGYGLGEFGGKNIAGVDLNTVFENGWHSYNGQGPIINGPDGYEALGNFAILEVSTAPFNNRPMTCVQTFTFGAGGLEGYQCKRAYNGTNWLPWCWINPPMLVGAEYRTTERYNAKPAYAMLMDCGVAPSSSEAWVEIKDANGNIPDIDNLVEMNATVKAGSNYIFSVPNADGDISAFFHTSGGSPKVIVKASGSSFAENGYHVYAVLKYTKSTD